MNLRGLIVLTSCCLLVPACEANDSARAVGPEDRELDNDQAYTYTAHVPMVGKRQAPAHNGKTLTAGLYMTSLQDLTDVTIRLFDANGSTTGEYSHYFQQAGQSVSMADHAIPAGTVSAVIESSRPIAGISQIDGAHDGDVTKGAYTFGSRRTDDPERGQIYIPLLMKNKTSASGTANSMLVVQNAGSQTADVEIRLVTAGGTTRTKTFRDVTAGASVTFSPHSDRLDGNIEIDDDWYGSATVRGHHGGAEIPLRAVFSLFTGEDVIMVTEGGTQAEDRWFIPLFASKLENGLSTPVTVQNASDTTIAKKSVLLECKAPDQEEFDAKHTYTNESEIKPGAAYHFNPVVERAEEPYWDAGFYGGCVVSAPADVVSFVQARWLGDNGGVAASYEAIPVGTYSSGLSYFPLVIKDSRFWNDTKNVFFPTVITAQSLAPTPTEMTFEYIPDPNYCPQDPAAKLPPGCDPATRALPALRLTQTVPPYGSAIHNLRLGSGTNSVANLPDGWRGSLAIRSFQPLDAFAQHFTMGASGDNMMAHRAYSPIIWGAFDPPKTDLYRDFIAERWQTIAGRRPDARFTDAVRAHDGTATPRTLDWNVATGPIVSDAYMLVTELPDDVDPRDLLREIRDDPNGMSDHSVMHRYTEFPPGTREYGSVANLSLRLNLFDTQWLAAGDDGAVAFWSVKLDDKEVCAMTVENAEEGRHPVAGMRCWGFFEDGPQTVFYTVAVDRWVNLIDGTSVPMPMHVVGGPLQSSTWMNLMIDLGELVSEEGGETVRILKTAIDQPQSVIDDPSSRTMPPLLDVLPYPTP